MKSNSIGMYIGDYHSCSSVYLKNEMKIVSHDNERDDFLPKSYSSFLNIMNMIKTQRES